IESQLLKHEAIKESVVLAKENSRIKYLCAYVVGNNELTVAELREHLSKELPDYMIPSYFVKLDSIPLTPNGKIDRKALPEPEDNIDAGVKYVAPTNNVEEKLSEIWSDVLGIEKIGINDDFFELGGHSLKATILIGKIHKEFNVEVSLREIFKTPTIKEISNYIQSASKTLYQTIEKVDSADYYEASSAQKRMYMLQQFDLSSTSYNMPGMLQIEGRLNLERVEKVFDELIRRHETLRTSFETIEEKIVQRVNETVVFGVEYIEKSDKDIDKIIKEFVSTFDLSKAPLFRVSVIELEKDKYILMFDMHHIISDGVSMGILVNEFASLYEGQELDKLRIQYKDYAEWQNKLLRSDVMKKQEEYWLDRFNDPTQNDGQVPVLNISTDYQRPTIQNFAGDSVNFKLDKELTKNLERIAKEIGSTLYMVLLSGVNILLARYSGQEDIIIGSPIAGRPHADLDKIIGMFVNTLAMRNYPEGKKMYKEFLQEVRDNALKAYENQDYQFEELVDKLELQRDLSRNPLFDVMFSMQNMDSGELNIKDIKLTPYNYENKISKFDLTFSASETDQEIIFQLEYSTKLFKRETVERMIPHLTNIYKVVAAKVTIKLSDIQMLTEEEKGKILYEFNNTAEDYPRDKTIHQIFEEQVAKTPDKIAVIYKDQKLTYLELNEKANQLASMLGAKGVKADKLVGLMVNRSLEMVIGMLGVLKSGAAYVPIDPKYPLNRIQYILEDSRIDILLIEIDLKGKIDFIGDIIDISDQEIYTNDNSLNLETISSINNLAYIIYTSGSTGKPKGVMVEQCNLTAYIHAFKQEFTLTSDDIVLQQASFAFDASVEEIYPILTVGGRLVLPENQEIVDIRSLMKTITENKVTLVSCSPLMLNEFNKNEPLNSIHTFISGGDVLKGEHITELLKYAKVYNTYGPTESTVCATYYRCTTDKITNIPIGKPISNYQVYILDKYQNICPIGVAGELCVSGDGVTRGYLNRDELTAEKFIQNPFVTENECFRIYRTGDLARWNSDGRIEFLGRIDHQVKIRGYRIELGEIESQLLKSEIIKDAIVIDSEDEDGIKYLCAYVVTEKKLTMEEITLKELREFLSKSLPEYMIPSYFVQLEKIPLTSNGKVDRKALPKPEGNIVLETEYVGPRNEQEKKLEKIWKEVLGTDQIGINDNFFELGGHSLKATILIAKVHKELNVEVPLSELFKTPTIKEIGEYIQNATIKAYEAIEKVERKEYYEASSAQKRLYILQQFDLQSTWYNMPSALNVEGLLNIEKVEKAFLELINRHETLRTSFETVEKKIVQKIHSNTSLEEEFKVEFIKNTDKTIEDVVNEFIRPFDLNKAPLFRVGVIELQEDKYILMFDMHHIISDGTSMGIFVNEFVRIYEGKELDELRIQYKDYAEWQNELLRSDVMKKQEEYWVNIFSDSAQNDGQVPVLNMPIDYSRPTMQSFEGDNISFKLDKELTKNLERIAKETGSTMYMVLLSGVNILLSKYSGQEDIIVGSPIAGRPHPDLDRIIGMFVNTLAMRNNPKINKSYQEFLNEVRENALKAYENQEYQFEELVDKLDIQRDLSRNPLFDVMFTMQNMDSGDLNIKDIKLTPYNYKNKTSKFDLTFFASEVNKEIILTLEYNTKLFKRDTIERMISHFQKILKIVVANTQINLEEIDILTEEEKHLILLDFNKTEVDYPKDKTLCELFEEQVTKTPDNIAVVIEQKHLTYQELNVRANQLARVLRQRGVKPDKVVAIMLERSLEMIIAIMGILKSGGAYLPIDPDYPLERKQYMLEDSNTEILLTQPIWAKKVNFAGNMINNLDSTTCHEDGSNLEVVNKPEDLLYVIYTSGSTGKPKGVMIEHRNIINLISFEYTKTNINFKSRVLQFTTISFDVSYQEIFSTLLAGGE
ncbi:MAG: amino acid adenylation domain-containing protein, partial [Halanaerobiales bacterium]|nr:amino acid adenylation domain-containing protein [Halanaerobiales bacterium]